MWQVATSNMRLSSAPPRMLVPLLRALFAPFSPFASPQFDGLPLHFRPRRQLALAYVPCRVVVRRRGTRRAML